MYSALKNTHFDFWYLRGIIILLYNYFVAAGNGEDGEQ